MGNIVTITAFRKALVHCLGMRQAMAALAFRYGLVFSGMTRCAGKLAVLCFARSEGRHDRIVARGTQV